PIETTNQVQQCGFARTRWSDDRHHLAARNAEADLGEGGDLPFAGKLLGNAQEVNHVGDYVNSFTMLSNYWRFLTIPAIFRVPTTFGSFPAPRLVDASRDRASRSRSFLPRASHRLPR